MNFFKSIKKYAKLDLNFLASKYLVLQIVGAFFRRWRFMVLFLIPFIAQLIFHCIHDHWYHFVYLTLAAILLISVCNTLTNVFNLKKNENGITWCQIFILIVIGCWIVGTMIIFDVKQHPRLATAIGVGGSMVGWIFQDTIKGVVAFIHLRLNGLLQIDDWIMVPKYEVDGEVKRVTLTTVTLSNWDTTTSSIPISALHGDHFKNLKKMMDGKTYGRQMLQTFIFDMGWIYNLSEEEAEKLKQSADIMSYLPEEEVKAGATNAHLFRIYLFHWLMNHPHISQQPRLIVRWLEQRECGMPLQVYAFIIDSSLAAFERQQSLIIEHILQMQEAFGLKLYQSPSAYDVSNSNIHLTAKAATYRYGEEV